MLALGGSLIAFTAAASLLTITPGLDTALVLRTAVMQGQRRAALAAMGIIAGCLAWTALVAMGLGALLTVSRVAYTALSWVGAAYLIWLGFRMLRHPRLEFSTEAVSVSERSAFRKGLLTNLLNPKIGVFYVSFLPRFVPHGAPVAAFILLLGAVHGVLGLIWFACLIAATAPAARRLRAPGVVAALDRLTGAVFVVFGIGVALESRPA